MIIKAEKEVLANEMGKSLDVLDRYIEDAEIMTHHWHEHKTSSRMDFPVRLSEDLLVSYNDNNGVYHRGDISEYAFSQLCGKVGVPAAYIKKCFANGLGDLAVKNYWEWSQRNCQETNLLVREYDGVIRAVLTDKYNVFNTASVLNNIRNAVEDSRYRGRYTLSQIYMDTDKLHIRFVDFENKIIVGRTELYPGFTVSSSDVGDASLNIKYFLYRFACRNGIVIIKNGGILFRQTHLRNFDEIGGTLFANALENMDMLNEYSAKQIAMAENKHLTADEMQMYLTRAKRELHLGKKIEAVEDLMNTVYTDRNLISFVNAITQNAQDYTLSTRLEHETWAGKLLDTAAA